MSSTHAEMTHPERQRLCYRMDGQEGHDSNGHHISADNWHSTQTPKDGSRIPVPCPQSIIDYSMFMGGVHVDRGDQVRQLQNPVQKN